MVLVSDDNFAPSQFTQFLLFAIDRSGTPSRVAPMTELLIVGGGRMGEALLGGLIGRPRAGVRRGGRGLGRAARAARRRGIRA